MTIIFQSVILKIEDMNPTAPTQPAAPTPAPAPSVTNTPNKPKKSLLVYPLVLIALVAGVVLGYFVFNTLPGNKPLPPAQVKAQSDEIVLPADAVEIQACSDHRGALYVKPADIPTGPVYMVSAGKVIGIEYMLGKDDFLGGKSYKDLAGEGLKVDHVNVGLLSQGHEGYPVPHYHVDMYTVSKDVEEAIVCAPSATPSASLTPATQSATQSSTTK